jgi:hypothetical protein
MTPFFHSTSYFAFHNTFHVSSYITFHIIFCSSVSAADYPSILPTLILHYITSSMLQASSPYIALYDSLVELAFRFTFLSTS